MQGRSNGQAVFWVVVGLAAGMLVADLVNVKTAQAVATAAVDDYSIATGLSNNDQLEALWILDYRGAKLLCYLINPNGSVGIRGEVDLAEIFALERGKPKFMMVTGRFRAQNIADILYVAETTTGKCIGFVPPQNATINPRRLPANQSQPIIVSKFVFAGEG